MKKEKNISIVKGGSGLTIVIPMEFVYRLGIEKGHKNAKLKINTDDPNILILELLREKEKKNE